MTEWILIAMLAIGVLVFVGLLLLLFLMKKRNKEVGGDMDYRMFYILGICFLPIGIVMIVVVSPAMLGIAVLGIIYLVIGLTNRDKWSN